MDGLLHCVEDQGNVQYALCTARFVAERDAVSCLWIDAATQCKDQEVVQIGAVVLYQC